ncbi:LuxR C-terminal-related transcriptional regulator [Kitasatospora sp. NPDC088160]|uniref:LuxR C-terminal-related transcriptional regulator n=1 Tax=Kitasatospora sp. NPDC088160 TaxID=3364072 RepID=UPI0037F2A8BA
MPRHHLPDHGWLTRSQTDITNSTSVASGLSYKAIARKLFLSDMTVKSHLHRLYARIGAQNGAHAVYLMHALNELPTRHPCPCDRGGATR